MVSVDSTSGIVPALLEFFDGEEGEWRHLVVEFVAKHAAAFRGCEKDSKDEEQKHSTHELFRVYTSLMERRLTAFAEEHGLGAAGLAEELAKAQEDSRDNEFVIQAILGALEYSAFVRLMHAEIQKTDQAAEAAADMGL